MNGKLPDMTTDEAAEALLKEDVSAYISRENFHPVSFEFLPKTEKVNLRFPSPLLKAVKARARQEGIPYQKLIRRIIEQALEGRP